MVKGGVAFQVVPHSGPVSDGRFRNEKVAGEEKKREMELAGESYAKKLLVLLERARGDLISRVYWCTKERY